MIKQIFSLALIALSTVEVARAQVAALPLLHEEQDLAAAAMAGVVALGSSTSSLYSLPTSWLYEASAGTFRVNTALGLYTAAGESTSRLASAALAYRSGRHNLMLGFRYLGLPETIYIDVLGQERGAIHPRDFSVDLGYALRLDEQWAAYARATYLQSYNSMTADVFSFSLGISYSRRLEASSYLLSAGIDGWGPSYKYGKSGTKQTQPSRATLGLSYTFLPREQLTLGLRAARYLSSEHSLGTIVGCGLQWKAIDKLSLRGGYTWQRDNGRYHLGVGYQWRSLGLDAAYIRYQQTKFNSFRLGLSCTI